MVVSLEDTLDVLKGIPFSLALPFVIVAALSCTAHGSHEFTVFRMYQYELHGSSFGCHGSVINMEARASTAQQLHRRCIITRLTDLTYSDIERMLERGAGSMLILLPSNMSMPLQPEEIKRWQRIEQSLLSQEVSIPIYFANEDNQLVQLYQETLANGRLERTSSAFSSLMGVFSAQGYQMVVGTSEAKPIKDPVISNIVGRLPGDGDEDQLPTIAFVAHYDSHGVAPDLSHGADSNGSGVVALLELARLFSMLYADEQTKAKFNLVFLLSGGGKYDFQGTKRWLDDSIDSDSNPLSNAHYVVCLDSIGRGSHLYLHVSKPPKQGTNAFAVVTALKEAVDSLNANLTMVHKKINLAEDRLAWEHERFSMKRLPAATLSRFPTYERAQKRNTIFDQRPRVEMASLSRNIRVIAEGIARHIYNLSGEHNSSKTLQVFRNSLSLDTSLSESWLAHLSSTPRSAQLLSKENSLLSVMENILGRYVPSVRRHFVKPDKRDPDFIFYDATKATMFAYSIKPAIFDLVLASVIALYLFSLYLLVWIFPTVVGAVSPYFKAKLKQL